jgi:exodeoxyribonuclease V alpha subunit
VIPGYFGGAIFSGVVVGKRKKITCIASYKNLFRTPAIGEFWKVVGMPITEGKYAKNPDKYGYQLSLSESTLLHLPTTDYISAFLVKHPAFRGFYFGKKKIKKLVDYIGSDALVELLNQGKTTDLSDILHSDIAKKLVHAWAGLKNETDTINFLREHHFDAALSRKVINLCKSNTVERLKNNPYALICFGGISKNIWRTVEIVARKLNIDKNDERRLIGAVEHVLYERLRDGHTAIEKDNLPLEVKKILMARYKLTDDQDLDNNPKHAIALALRKKAVCVLNSDSKTLIQLLGPAYIESSIERRLERLLTGEIQQSLLQANEATINYQVKQYSTEFYNEFGLNFSDEQLQAIKLGLNQRCALISGYGGTGKTTILRAITDISVLMNRKVYLMALAGKAKERMAQATDHDAMTIHSFIKAVKEKNDRVDIDCDPLIIIDETSMVDIALFNKLLAIFDGLPFSLLTVGDTSQLSPVGFGIIWHKMALSEKIPLVHLTKVYRQTAQSPIH